MIKPQLLIQDGSEIFSDAVDHFVRVTFHFYYEMRERGPPIFDRVEQRYMLVLFRRVRLV